MGCRLVLASGSASRRAILENAGIAFTLDPAHVDEGAIKAREKTAGRSIPEIVESLADAKALEVSPRHPGALILGGDQVLELEGTLYDKVQTLSVARSRLLAMAGKTHRLIGALSLVCDGTVVARHQSVSHLTMRNLSPGAIDTYLAKTGDAILSSVGCYHFEGMGAQLFEHVEGDYFAILGLDLMPLLALLRTHGIGLGAQA